MERLHLLVQLLCISFSLPSVESGQCTSPLNVYLKGHGSESIGQYFQSNRPEGGGMSWGKKNSALSWKISWDGAMTSGAEIQIFGNGEQKYWLSNSVHQGGFSWGKRENKNVAWRIHWDRADDQLRNGGEVHLYANGAKDFFASNSAEGTGMSFGGANGAPSSKWNWQIEWDGDCTFEPNAAFSLVAEQARCSGKRTVSKEISAQACSEKCNTPYFAYGSLGECADSVCKCSCEEVGNKCDQLQHNNYTLYKKNAAYEMVKPQTKCSGVDQLADEASVEACGKRCGEGNFAFGACTNETCKCGCEKEGEECEQKDDKKLDLYKTKFKMIHEKTKCDGTETGSWQSSVLDCAQKCISDGYFAYGRQGTDRCNNDKCRCECQTVGKKCDLVNNDKHDLYSSLSDEDLEAEANRRAKIEKAKEVALKKEEAAKKAAKVQEANDKAAAKKAAADEEAAEKAAVKAAELKKKAAFQAAANKKENDQKAAERKVQEQADKIEKAKILKDQKEERAYKEKVKADDVAAKGMFRLGMKLQGLLDTLSRVEDQKQATELKTEISEIEKQANYHPQV